MGYSLTTEKGGFIRIEGKDASITFRCSNDRAQLLSVMVSRESRGMGAGKSIISAAEAELSRRGILTVRADFVKDIEGIPDFLRACGYDLRDSSPIVSVDTDLLLGAKAVRKAMQCSFEECFFISANDLLDQQWNELFLLFNKLSIPIVKPELGSFSEELSGVVYNEDLFPKAFIFCSVYDDILYVDFLGGVSKKEPQYIMAALKGMLSFFKDGSDRQRCKKIVMLLFDDIVSQLLKRALDRGTSISEFGGTFHAEKRLSAIVPDGYIFYDMEDGDCTYMDAAPAMEYMGMPDEVVFNEPEDNSYPVEPEEDTITLFESCLTETGVDTEAYEKYIDVIVPSAEPKARQFYNWFRQGI